MIDGPIESSEQDELTAKQGLTVLGLVFCAFGYLAVLAFQVIRFGW